MARLYEKNFPNKGFGRTHARFTDNALMYDAVNVFAEVSFAGQMNPFFPV